MIVGYAALERQVASLHREFRSLRQGEEAAAAPRRSAVVLAAELGVSLDPWQRGTLETDRDALLLVTRQGGKGMVASLLALEALEDPGSTTVIIAKADRQAKRLLRRVKRLYRSLPDALPTVVDSTYALELTNGAEILALPGSEETVRGVEAVDLLICDEAALIPNELFAAVYPMLATTSGRCVAMTTPRGKRGWFYGEWSGGSDTWHRASITALDIPRIKPDWLQRTRLRLGDWVFRQEFLCEFLDTDDQIFATDLIEGSLTRDVAPLFPIHGMGVTA